MIELLVALAIGGVIISGALYVYDQSRNTYVINDSVARIQEQGRFAMSLVESELQLAGYLGYTNLTNGFRYRSSGKPLGQGVGYMRQWNSAEADIPAAAHACGRNFAIDIYQPVQGSNNEYKMGPSPTAACDAQGGGYLAGTDTITVRRASTEAESALDVNTLQFFISRMGMNSNFVSIGLTTTPKPIVTGMYEVRDLVLRTFYISVDSDGFPGVPALRMKSLRALNDPGGAFLDEELATGVEDLQIQFGVDTGSYDGDAILDNDLGNDLIPDANGQATRYVNANDTLVDPTNLNAAQIVAVRIWLRVRGDAPERGFTDNRTYNYAGVSYTPAGDEALFRRVLISKTIQLRNTRTL